MERNVPITRMNVARYSANGMTHSNGIAARLVVMCVVTPSIRLDGTKVRRTDFLAAFEEIAAGDGEIVWMFLIGHGNYDGEEYKFNIKGPDLKGSDLGLFLKSLEDRPVRMVVATGSSGVLVSSLGGGEQSGYYCYAWSE